MSGSRRRCAAFGSARFWFSCSATASIITILLVATGVSPWVVTASLLVTAGVTTAEVRRELDSRHAAGEARLREAEHRHQTSTAQSRLLRDWVVRQQQFLDGVVTSMQAGIIAVNRDGNVTTSNRAAASLLGGESVPVGSPVVAAESRVERMLQAALEDEEPPNEEIVVRSADGVSRTLSVHVRKVTDRERSVLGAVAALHDVTHLRSHAEEMTRIAMEDELTGLPNRHLLLDRLAHALARAARTGDEVAVLFIDLDGFKRINDSYGHEAGDTVLRAAARRLVHTIRPNDTAARFGGDEFVLVCEGPDVSKEAEQIAQRVHDHLVEPVVLADDEVTVGCSIGLAIGDGSCQDPALLLSAADEAMYVAKRQTEHTRIEVSDRRIASAGENELLETELSQAMLRHDLNLEYQPITDLATTTMVGVEALVRWDHPIRGRLTPKDFLPVAERSGLIVPIGRALFAEACQLIGLNNEAADTPLLLHVNISARQLADRRLESRVLRELERTGLTPESLCLEIREQDLMGVGDQAPKALEALSRAGVRLAVDDFGSGPASVTLLRSLPIDIVKIDHSHIEAMQDSDDHEALVRAVIHLSKNFGIAVVAEGVETQWQRDRLLELGCRQGQGFLFSHPKPPVELGLVTLPT